MIKTTETSVTTPLTSTIVETKVRASHSRQSSRPEADWPSQLELQTVVSIPTAQRTPAATRYVTEVSTTEPATSTSTATQTVATGESALPLSPRPPLDRPSPLCHELVLRSAMTLCRLQASPTARLSEWCVGRSRLRSPD